MTFSIYVFADSCAPSNFRERNPRFSPELSFGKEEPARSLKLERKRGRGNEGRSSETILHLSGDPLLTEEPENSGREIA